MTFIYNFFLIIFRLLRGKKTDYFLPYKYDQLKEFYSYNNLDIEAGTGRFSKYLKDHGHEVTAIDVVEKSEVEDITIQQFNGRKLPFEDKSFGNSIFMFVLHHTDNQQELLEEAKRISKKHIIVGEDIVENKIDKMLGNIHLNTSPWAKGYDSFRSEQGWLKLFEQLNLKIIKNIEIPVSVYPVYPVSRRIFVLEV